MAVFPDDSKPRPEGTYTASDVRALQDMTEEDVRRKIRAPVDNAFTQARSNFLQALQREVFAPLAGIFSGEPDGGLPELSTAVTDQQSKINTLIDERGRGQVFSSQNISYRGAQQFMQRKLIPFTEQVGPLVDVTIHPDGGLVLHTPGSWEITAKVGVSGTAYFGADWQRMWIEAKRADESLLAESWATGFAGKEQATMLDVLQFVINADEAAKGVTVRVYQDAGRWRYLLGGHGYTLLKAQKLSSSQAMSNANPGDPGTMTESE